MSTGRKPGDSSAKTSSRRKVASGRRLLFVLSAVVVLLFFVVVAIPRGPVVRVGDTPAHPEAVSPPDEPAPVARPEPPLQPAPETSPVPQIIPDPAPPAQVLPSPEYRGTLYLVIDDAGYSLADLERFLAFPHPLTIAVLPHLPQSTQSSLRAARAGKEVILHLPMEAENGADPGPGAIMVALDEAQIRRRVHEALASVPGATGANNHMGSRATSDRRVMDTVVSELAVRGLFFLDSRTSARTVARPAAMAAGIRFTERHVFLDNERNHESIRRALSEGLRIAADRGHAVMIGHVMVDELAEVLMDVYPTIIQQGFEFGFLSDLMTASVAYERTGN